jgi:hypothetical protein
MHLSSSLPDYRESRRDRLVEVCLIGLASYFEAFCKNQFASIINICPQTLYKFTQRRENATVKLPHLVSEVLRGFSKKLLNLHHSDAAYKLRLATLKATNRIER